MKERISITIEPRVKYEFDEVCDKIAAKWGSKLSRSQLIESMIIGWCKKNGGKTK